MKLEARTNSLSADLVEIYSNALLSRTHRNIDIVISYIGGKQTSIHAYGVVYPLDIKIPTRFSHETPDKCVEVGWWKEDQNATVPQNQRN